MMISRFEALKAVDDIFNYCEEIDNSLPENERSGYKMLPDIHKIRKYIIEDERPHGEWISCSERLPKENICDDGYVEPSDYVLVFGDKGDYGVSRYWGNRISKKENPNSFSDWMDLDWYVEKPIAWMPLPKPYEKEGEKND